MGPDAIAGAARVVPRGAASAEGARRTVALEDAQGEVGAAEALHVVSQRRPGGLEALEVEGRLARATRGFVLGADAEVGVDQHARKHACGVVVEGRRAALAVHRGEMVERPEEGDAVRVEGRERIQELRRGRGHRRGHTAPRGR